VSTHASLFIEHAIPQVQTFLGDAATYTVDGVGAACTVVAEPTVCVENQDDDGRANRYERTFLIAKTDVAAVRMDAEITFGGDVWSVSEISADSPSGYFAVKAIRVKNAEVSRRGFRGTGR
jgi:hypothetical protein